MTTTTPITAYWFAAGNTLPHGDGRKIIVGKTHSLQGKIILCQHALHASRDPFDALGYAPGPILYQVECGGTVVEQGDKLGCSRRTYIKRIDAPPILQKFARMSALSCIQLWDAPDVVRRFLETGDEELRAAARAAAREAAAAASAAAAAAAARAAWEAAREHQREEFNVLVTAAFA